MTRALVAVLAVVVAAAAAPVPLRPQPDGVPYPTNAWPQAASGTDVDRAGLAAAIDAAFVPTGWAGLRDTRAVLVVHHGAVVAERYAPDSARTSASSRGRWPRP